MLYNMWAIDLSHNSCKVIIVIKSKVIIDRECHNIEAIVTLDLGVTYSGMETKA